MKTEPRRMSRPLPDRGAKLITEALAPSVIVVVLPLLVAWNTTHTWGATALWGLLVAFASSILPMAVIVWGGRTGKWDGHHVRDREGRFIPFVLLIALSTVGLAILLWAGAPWPMIALDMSLLGGLLCTGAITIWWKVSLHAAVAAGAVVILTVTFDLSTLAPSLYALWLTVAAVCWSRVRLQDHTTAQVIVGAVVGSAVGGGLYVLAL